MENIENQTNTNVEGATSEKLEDNTTSTGDITMEQFKSALENNIECKGYFDSLCDKTVNTRLDKSVETWKTNNLENLINQEINKRYPQKTEAEIKFEEQQQALEKAQAEKQQLELQIKYHDLMAENKLPMEILDFVAGKDIETTITNIGRFKELAEKFVADGIQKEVDRRLKASAYVPGSSANLLGFSSGSMWD
ncbi:DUF4355 domain-containing protein [Clostridium butyricum]|uniref:DUF4355 domain-containing protein n=1 Tax=Clostridium butyricum TaxID=1492 RepID=UPI0012B7071E|nr:DUF4355 domain-containing protein [Clostridium butyricum]